MRGPTNRLFSTLLTKIPSSNFFHSKTLLKHDHSDRTRDLFCFFVHFLTASSRTRIQSLNGYFYLKAAMKHYYVFLCCHATCNFHKTSSVLQNCSKENFSETTNTCLSGGILHFWLTQMMNISIILALKFISKNLAKIKSCWVGV